MSESEAEGVIIVSELAPGDMFTPARVAVGLSSADDTVSVVTLERDGSIGRTGIKRDRVIWLESRAQSLWSSRDHDACAISAVCCCRQAPITPQR